MTQIERMPWHHRYGFLHRLRECWWILSGRWSLHRAWQDGLDQGTALEYHRLIRRKAYISEVVSIERAQQGRAS